MGDSEALDIVAYGASSEDCSDVIFAVVTRDEWLDLELDGFLVLIDSDRSAATGCNGNDLMVGVLWLSGIGLTSAATASPSCSSATWTVLADEIFWARFGSDDIGLAVPANIIGSGGSFRWSLGLNSLYGDLDLAPNSGWHTESLAGGGSGGGPTCFGSPATIVAVRGRTTRGTSGPDVIVGTSGNDVIKGRGGNDKICSKGGDDDVSGGYGADMIDLGRGDDVAAGGGGRDVIRGGPGADRIEGNGSSDRIEGKSGRDRLEGGSGDDTVLGGSGHDRIFGGGGRDLLKGGSGRDRLKGGTGKDNLVGGRHADVLSGNSGNDRLRGNSGPDELDGGGGVDDCDGGSGKDVESSCE